MRKNVFYCPVFCLAPHGHKDKKRWWIFKNISTFMCVLILKANFSPVVPHTLVCNLLWPVSEISFPQLNNVEIKRHEIHFIRCISTPHFTFTFLEENTNDPCCILTMATRASLYCLGFRKHSARFSALSELD